MTDTYKCQGARSDWRPATAIRQHQDPLDGHDDDAVPSNYDIKDDSMHRAMRNYVSTRRDSE